MTWDLQVPVDNIGIVYQLAQQHEAERVEENYQESGDVMLVMRIRMSETEAFQNSLRNATSANVTCDRIPRQPDQM